tara:strand:+ start:239 stop:355 length:117 start_codon:yes stop_codon:yes gene_type:complete
MDTPFALPGNVHEVSAESALAIPEELPPDPGNITSLHG